MNVVFTTGADSKLFLNLCVLLDSFAVHVPEHTLHVCDFGFEPGHRTFLEHLGVLRPTPEDLTHEEQTWKHKASLFDFFAGAEPAPDAVVWLDADMVVRRPIAAAVETMAAELEADGAVAALCTDSAAMDIRGFIAANETPDTNLDPFRRLLETYGSDLAAPYLNTGFFILRRGAFADLWRDETRRQPLYLLYEQNAFNALAAAPDHGVVVLDPAIWNVHGELLDAVQVDGSASVLHTTSAGGQHALSQVGIPVGDRQLSGNFKVFSRPELMQLQGDHLSGFVRTHHDALAKVLV